MPRGGARPGAGRPRDAWSKRTVEDMRRVGPMGERALAVLTAAMENPKVPWSARITAAGMIADRASRPIPFLRMWTRGPISAGSRTLAPHARIA
jgi:hypothetical protein